MSRIRSLVVVAACTAVAAACSSRDHEKEASKEPGGVRVSLSSDSGVSVATATPSVTTPSDAKPTFTEEAGGAVSMRTTNGALVMSLRHDSVVMAFSDSLRNAVKRDVKQSMNESKKDSDAGAFAGVIQGVVEKTVSATMTEVFDKARGFPVSDLRDVSYTDGAIKFDFKHKPTWNFESMKSDKTPILEQFHPADAARFVGAVRAQLKQS
jgi:hypothetical protein